MGGLFSKKKNKVTNRDKAVLDLKVQRDKLRQYTKQVIVYFSFYFFKKVKSL